MKESLLLGKASGMIKLVFGFLFVGFMGFIAFMLFFGDSMNASQPLPTMESAIPENFDMNFGSPSTEVTNPSMHPVDAKGNLVIDVDKVINEWTGHPFYKDNAELMEISKKKSDEIIQSYLNDEISRYELKDYSVEMMEALNDYFYDGQVTMTSIHAVGTMTLSSDFRLNMVGLEYFLTQDPEILYEFMAFDHYFTKEFAGMSPEAVSKTIINHYKNNPIDDLK